SRAGYTGGSGEHLFIDHCPAQIFAIRAYTTAEPNIAIPGRLPSLLQGGVNPFGHETKLGAAFHAEWCPRMMSQHEHGGVVGWLVAPPSCPVFVGPGSSDWTKHVPTE